MTPTPFTTYKRGSFFIDDQGGGVFMLARAGGTSDKHCALIDLNGGNLWSTPVRVANFQEITEEELEAIKGKPEMASFRFYCDPIDFNRHDIGETS